MHNPKPPIAVSNKLFSFGPFVTIMHMPKRDTPPTGLLTAPSWQHDRDEPFTGLGGGFLSAKPITGIYKITSPIGEVYIGKSKDIHYRFGQYRNGPCKSQKKLHNSFVKLGIDKHTFEVIEKCIEQELVIKERKWIKFYNSDRQLNGRLTKAKIKKLIKRHFRECESKAVKLTTHGGEVQYFETVKLGALMKDISEEEIIRNLLSMSEITDAGVWKFI